MPWGNQGACRRHRTSVADNVALVIVKRIGTSGKVKANVGCLAVFFSFPHDSIDGLMECAHLTDAEGIVFHPSRTDIEPMHLIRYRPEYRESMLALHRSAVAGLTLGMSQEEDEVDLMAVEQVYLQNHGEFLIGLIDERLVAMGGFQRLSDTAAELRRMRIERGLQGKGYGTQLLREL
jgi:Acetyltransferase (GNAT) family